MREPFFDWFGFVLCILGAIFFLAVAVNMLIKSR